MKLTIFTIALFGAAASSIAIANGQATPAPARLFTPEPVSVLTQRYNNGRTGANLSEHVLSVSSISSGEFQKLYSSAVDGQVYAQPLFVPHVNFQDGTKNLLIIATMKNQVYAFQVDDAIYGPAFSPVLLWSVNLGPPVPGNFIAMASSGYRCVGRLMCVPMNPQPTSNPWTLPPVGMSPRDVVAGGYGSYNINPSIGIVSTPVVDSNLGRVFLVSKQMAVTKHPASVNNCITDTRNGSASPVNRLISLDLRTGAELACVDLGLNSASWQRGVASDRDHSTKKIQLNNKNQMQRPALLLQNGEIYAGLASHQDTFPWHGWIFAYDEDLKFKAAWISTPNGMGGGIWQSGSGLAGDAQGRIYAMTGNGERDSFVGIGPKWFDLSTQSEWPFHNYAGMFVQLSRDPHVIGHYDTGPTDELYRELLDEDVGASGPVLMPDTTFVIGGDNFSALLTSTSQNPIAGSTTTCHIPSVMKYQRRPYDPSTL